MTLLLEATVTKDKHTETQTYLGDREDVVVVVSHAGSHEANGVYEKVKVEGRPSGVIANNGTYYYKQKDGGHSLEYSALWAIRHGGSLLYLSFQGGPNSVALGG